MTVKSGIVDGGTQSRGNSAAAGGRTTERRGIARRAAERGRFLPRLAWFRLDVLVATLAINVLSLAMPIVVLQVYDRIIPRAAVDTFVLLLIGLGVVLLLDGFLRMLRHYVTSRWAARFEHTAGCQAMQSLLMTDIANFQESAPGVHLDRLSAIDKLREFYGSQAVIALVDLPFVVVFLVLIALIGGPLVAVPVIVLALSAINSAFIGRWLHQALKCRQQNDDRRYSFIIEVLTGIHSIKGLAMEAQMSRRHERLQESSAESNYSTVYRAVVAQGVGVFSSQVTFVAVVGLGSLMVISGSLTVGMLAACSMLAGRSVKPMLSAMSVWTQFQNIKIAEAQASEILRLPRQGQANAPIMPRLEGGIELVDVQFAHPGMKQTLLKDINLTVNPGETVAICGDSGSGKSTLLWLMMGLLKPDSGHTLLDGCDPSQFDPISVRSQIGYLPQNSVLFRGTFLENMTMFRGDEYLDSAMELAAKLGLDEVLARLPDGLETKVGNTTSETLPRGVRQSIGIVRALVARPKIVLFDGANTSLDVRTTGRVKALLEELHPTSTLVLITHQPSLQRLADRVYDLRDGTLSLRKRTKKNVVRLRPSQVPGVNPDA